MGYYEFLCDINEVEKKPPTQIEKKRVVGENDKYIVVTVSNSSELYELGKGTSWEVISGEIDDLDQAWQEFSNGQKVYVALKKKLGKPELKRADNLESKFRKIKIYPYWDKVLIRVDGKGVAQYWNTGNYSFDTPKVELPEFAGVKNWIKRSDGSFDVKGDVIVTDDMLKEGELPWRFNTVFGSFNLSKCLTLTSYVGCPKVVYNDFKCATKSNISSLAGCPKIVGGDFDCVGHKSLTTLEGSPTKVVGSFNISRCDNIEDFVGGPDDVGNLYASYCKKLSTFEGSPAIVRGDVICTYSPNLGSLKWLTDDVGGIVDVRGGRRITDRTLWNRYGYEIPDNIRYDEKKNWGKGKDTLLETLNSNKNKTVNTMRYKMQFDDKMLKAVDFLVECKVGSTVETLFEGKKGVKDDKDADKKKKEKEAKAKKLADLKKKKEDKAKEAKSKKDKK